MIFDIEIRNLTPNDHMVVTKKIVKVQEAANPDYVTVTFADGSKHNFHKDRTVTASDHEILP